MIRDIIANRYAKAFFSISEKSKDEEVIKQELQTLSHAIEANRELKSFIFNPLFGTAVKEEVLICILKKMKSSEATINFIKLLLKKDRLKYLKEITENFTRLFDEKQNIKKALVVTASKLPDKNLSKIKERLSLLTKKNIEIEERVDDSIIGGILIQMGSLVYNGSIQTQLDDVKKRLLLKE